MVRTVLCAAGMVRLQDCEACPNRTEDCVDQSLAQSPPALHAASGMLAHEIITASAGSGKTWSLVVRFIRLLAMGAEPRTIIALTFSRKAAGEFFTAILHRLAEAALTDEAAATLARDLEQRQLKRADFVRMLAALVREMPLLTLGTMDSFFVRIARSFPLELGLAGDFAILDDHQQGIEQQRVLQRVFAPGRMQEEGRKEFLTAFQQATFGKEEVRLKRLIVDFLDDWQQYYLQAPDGERWGNPAAIWRDGFQRPAADKPWTDLIAATRSAVESSSDISDKQKPVLQKMLAALETHTFGTPVHKDAKGPLEKLLELLPELAAGEAVITLNRVKATLHPPLTMALHTLTARFVHDTLVVCLHQTQGIYRILRLYDEQYHAAVRRQGRLTFQDVQFILSGDLAAADTTLAGASREDIDYRLDACFAHWLLDEFQDTSRVQWRVLRNLCDEAIQDTEGTRSFFAVGDEKQSIFTWRGAEPELFAELRRHYGPAIKVRPLSHSQRSGPAVIAQVNRLCGDPAKLAQLDGLAGGAERWNWQEHTSAHPEYTGCAAVIEVPAEEEGEENAVWLACAELLKQIQPLRRDLTCAVLCHRNVRAAEIADLLRTHSGMEVVCESDVSVAKDNPAASAFLSLLKAAAHPADLFSWQHVLMSPLGELIAARWPDTEGPTAHRRQMARRGVFTAEVLAQIAAEGFEKTLRAWWKRLLQHLPALDSFSTGRVEELCRAAGAFDAGGSRDADEFLAFAENWSVRESACTTAVQVMTLHKSKGLTFDIVILPDLHDRAMFQHRYSIGVQRGPEQEIEWITQLPGKDIAAADEVIARALENHSALQWRERLAQLYVAVTRARRANYLLLPPPPKTGTSLTLPRIVRHMLIRNEPQPFRIGERDRDLLDCEGSPDWWQGEALTTVQQPSPAEDLFAALPAAAVDVPQPLKGRRVRARASAARFSAHGEGRRFGSLVHLLFSRVEWSGPGAMESVEQFFRRTLPQPEDWQFSALETVQRCLQDREISRALAQPAPDSVLWRERPFEATIEGKLVSGVFDRVTISGGIAQLLDFKTDRIDDSPEALAAASSQHARQTQIYRAALEKLTGLPVQASLLFTAVNRTSEAF
jgi:ATP-dependent helicase/nuclease subunit A